jgi:CubicO group peptidase (beta-lactamase class C family)
MPVNTVHTGSNPSAVRRLLLTAAGVVALLAISLSAAVPAGRPEDVGLSSERLQRISQVVQREIDAKQISGAVTVVARRGRIAHFEAQGLMDIESRKAMQRDTVFPIASMSKPITGVAILMLVEEGKVRLSDPVSRFIPEFRNTQVAMPRSSGRGAAGGTAAGAGGRGAAPEIYTVPASREVTVRDLMTHTSGLASGGAGTREAGRIAPRTSTTNLAEYIPKLGAAPLDFQPGTQWAYSALAGIETLGRIVEVASGTTFDQFLKTRLFDPLGMKDTTFVPRADQAPRIVTLYDRSPNGLTRQEVPAWLATRTLFSGGGGLWSTAEDYLQFGQMLVQGGELNGKRLLSPRTVALMSSNHVGELFARAGATGGRVGMGFGLTVDVVLDSVVAGEARSTGSFGWGGAFGTNFWVDPKEQIVGVLMVQTPGGPLRADFQNAVRQAIID